MARSDRNRRHYLKHREAILAAKAARDAETRAQISAYNAAYYQRRKAQVQMAGPEARQAWLELALAEAVAIVNGAGFPVPPGYKIVYHSEGAASKAGHCAWRDQTIAIFGQNRVSLDTFEVVVHEVCHAAQGHEPGMRAHGPEFQRVAAAAGLLPPWTKTRPGPELVRRAEAWITRHGEYPPRSAQVQTVECLAGRFGLPVAEMRQLLTGLPSAPATRLSGDAWRTARRAIGLEVWGRDWNKPLTLAQVGDFDLLAVAGERWAKDIGRATVWDAWGKQEQPALEGGHAYMWANRRLMWSPDSEAAVRLAMVAQRLGVFDIV